MKVVLIYDAGDQWTSDLRIEEFEDEKEMICFVNKEKVGDCIQGCYKVHKEIVIEPFEKVLEYKIKD